MILLCNGKRIFSFFLILGFLGCSNKNELTHEESCSNRFESLHEKFLKKKYSVIREPLSDLLSTCNGSGFIEQVLFELAESHFFLKEWLEAQSEYANLLRDFPGSKYGEISHFRSAECSKKQIYSVDRDQSKTNEAIEDYQAFISNYPISNLVDSAGKQIHILRTQLANKDLRTARHYLKMGAHQAAAIYYKSILKKFSAQVEQKEIHLNLTQCYIALNQLEEAESYLKDFEGLDPKDDYYSKVQKLYHRLEQKKSQNMNKINRTKKKNSTSE